MKTYNGWQQYQPSSVPPEDQWKLESGLPFFIDEDGNDWYQLQRTYEGSQGKTFIWIVTEHRNGISQSSENIFDLAFEPTANSIFGVVETVNLPNGYVNGGWQWVVKFGGEIVYMTDDEFRQKLPLHRETEQNWASEELQILKDQTQLKARIAKVQNYYNSYQYLDMKHATVAYALPMRPGNSWDKKQIM
jgi:hypothetical protein